MQKSKDILMKQIAEFIRKFFKKPKALSSLYSEAVAEGIRDTMKEMGYHFENNNKAVPKKPTAKRKYCKIFFL